MRFASLSALILIASVATTVWAAPAPPTASGATPATAASTKAEAFRGFVLSKTCAFCHGTKDYTVPYPTRHVPYIAGQHAAYIEAAFKEYADGDRDFPTMKAQAQSLTKQQIHDIAVYIAGLAPVPPPTNGNAKAPPFAATCAACHGAHGISTNPNYPSLAGQYEDYIILSLKEYKTGKRKNPIMNAEAAGLTLAQMKKLAHYFGQQKVTPLGLLPLNGPAKYHGKKLNGGK